MKLARSALALLILTACASPARPASVPPSAVPAWSSSLAPRKTPSVEGGAATEAQPPSPASAAPLEAPATVAPPEFPDRIAVEAMDRLAQVVAVHHDGRGSIVRMGTDSLFEIGTAELSGGARWRLDAIAAALALQHGRTVHVRVYTDSLGARDESEALSRRRASALRDYFVSRGAPAERVLAEGRGAAQPVDDNRTSAGRAANRRVEILVEPPR